MFLQINQTLILYGAAEQAILCYARRKMYQNYV